MRPAYSLKHYNSCDRESIERRRVRLQKWRERMGARIKELWLHPTTDMTESAWNRALYRLREMVEEIRFEISKEE